jgi:IS4 transposase
VEAEAMLGDVFARFVEKSPISVMVRGMLERVLGAEQLDEWYARTAEKQYTRELLFSTVYELLSKVVFGIKPSVHAAYQEQAEEIRTSIVSVYNKLNGLELHTSAELVRYSAATLSPIIDGLGGRREPWLAGYRVKILDGNCIEATEHRLKELRGLRAGALPGKSLVVYDPVLGIATDVFPCEDGHAQERALLSAVLPTLQAGELWLHDRNFCTREFLCGHAERGAFFISRQHQQLPFEVLSAFRAAGRVETGKVAEQQVRVVNTDGQAQLLRRIRVELDQPTRDGDRVLYLLTNLPRRAASAKRVARLYRKRWTLETAFQELEGHFHSEINTLGYPKAALFGFCLALVAYNSLAVVWAALRSVHGASTIDQEVSGYYIAHEIAETQKGMMIAIPAPEWRVFVTMTTAELVVTMLALAQHVRLRAFRKHPRGPKKPQPKRHADPQQPHVSTAKLLSNRKAKSVAP